jgi:hypothetical protein
MLYIVAYTSRTSFLLDLSLEYVLPPYCLQAVFTTYFLLKP